MNYENSKEETQNIIENEIFDVINLEENKKSNFSFISSNALGKLNKDCNKINF